MIWLNKRLRMLKACVFFSVYLNGLMTFGNLDLTGKNGVQTAVGEKYITEVKDGEDFSLRVCPCKRPGGDQRASGSTFESLKSGLNHCCRQLF